MDDVFDATRLRISTKFGKIEHVIDSFNERSAASLHSLEEGCLTVIQLRFGK